MRTLLRDLGTVSGVQCACIVRGGQVLATTFPDSEAVAQAASLGFVRGISDGLELVDRGLEELQVDFQGRSLMVAPVAKDFVLAMLAAPDANTQLLRVVMGSSVRQLRRMHDIPEKAEAGKPVSPAAAGQPAAAAARPGAPQPPPPPQAGAPRPGAPAAPAPPKPPQQAAPASPPQAAKPAPTGRPQPPPPPGRPSAPPPPPPGRPAAAPPQQAAKPAQPAQAAASQATATQPPKPGAKPATPAQAAPAAAAKPAEKDAEPVLPQVLALLTEYIGPVARVSFKRGVTRWRETSTPTVGTLNELAKILAADLSTDSEKKAFMDAVDRLRGS